MAKSSAEGISRIFPVASAVAGFANFYNLGSILSEQAERKRIIENDLVKRGEMLRIANSDGDGAVESARYSYLQSVDGITPDERREIDVTLKLGQEDESKNGDNPYKVVSPDSARLSVGGCIPFDTSLYTDKTREASKVVLSRITSFVGSNGGAASGAGSQSGSQSTESAASGESTGCQSQEHLPVLCTMNSFPRIPELLEDEKTPFTDKTLVVEGLHQESSRAWVNAGLLAALFPLIKEKMESGEVGGHSVRLNEEQDTDPPAIVIRASPDISYLDLIRSIYLVCLVRTENGLKAVEQEIKSLAANGFIKILASLSHLSSTKNLTNECKSVADIILKNIEPKIVQKMYKTCFEKSGYFYRDEPRSFQARQATQSGLTVEPLVYVQVAIDEPEEEMEEELEEEMEEELEDEMEQEWSNKENEGGIYKAEVYECLYEYINQQTDYFKAIIAEKRLAVSIINRLLNIQLRLFGLFVSQDRLEPLKQLSTANYTPDADVQLHPDPFPELQHPFPNLSGDRDYPLAVVVYDPYAHGFGKNNSDGKENISLPDLCYPSVVLDTLYIMEEESRSCTFSYVDYAHPTRAGYIMRRLCGCHDGPANKW
ncbi:hypothetical protein [Endozoicomonas euniceicola]|uniref:Uncharacterized protein n=1 Tax=Endozoicomonas euniceicola TaxID=1234143 RepID=A0ABY6GYT9_9GAMM|nr:hypothetical protein [Endozoicomonas euniceicola]UYM17952.1 hypothetical protein NX720_08625 [Endozoicomonas euniceicola]